jgi:hypothetical protein
VDQTSCADVAHNRVTAHNPHSVTNQRVLASLDNHPASDPPHLSHGTFRHLGPPPRLGLLIEREFPRGHIGDVSIHGRNQLRLREILVTRHGVGDLEIGDQIRMAVKHRVPLDVTIAEDESAEEVAHACPFWGLVAIGSPGPGGRGGQRMAARFAADSRE